MSQNKKQNHRLAPTNYAQRVMQLRRKYDLLPWLEVYSVNWTAPEKGGKWLTRDDPGRSHSLVHNQPYDLLVSEVICMNQFRGATNDPVGENGSDGSSDKLFFSYAVPCEFQMQLGASGAEVATAPMDYRQVTGTLSDELRRFQAGILVRQRTPVTFRLRTPAPIIMGAFFGQPTSVFFQNFRHETYVALRGYRLYPKGSLMPQQKTRQEYSNEGYHFEPFTPVLKVAVPNDGSELAAEFNNPDNLAVDYFSSFMNVRDIDWENSDSITMYTGDVYAKVEVPGGIHIMKDFAPIPLVGALLQRTAWNLVQPLTTLREGTWKLTAKVSTPNAKRDPTFKGEPMTVALALHGHKVVKGS
jgi:hypothetical protein